MIKKPRRLVAIQDGTTVAKVSPARLAELVRVGAIAVVPITYRNGGTRLFFVRRDLNAVRAEAREQRNARRHEHLCTVAAVDRG